MLESPIQHDVFRELNRRTDTRIFRNNVGQGWVGKLTGQPAEVLTLRNYRPIRFGLRTGSGDLIGWHTVTITPDMVGRRVAVFLSIETKSNTGTADPEQKNWAEQVRYFGGISGIARSVSDAITIINPITGI